jgi:hypothetical protein
MLGGPAGAELAVDLGLAGNRSHIVIGGCFSRLGWQFRSRLEVF